MPEPEVQSIAEIDDFELARVRFAGLSAAQEFG
jgi:hypothetical protein